MSDRIQMILLHILPKNTISRFVGVFAGSRYSRWIIPMYARFYNVDLEQAEKPINEYKTLTDFFTRRLKNTARSIDMAETALISPVDGVVSEFGGIENDTLVQAKGVTYSVSQLVGSPDKAKLYEGGKFITIYLSPRDYHRIHTPMKGTVSEYTYIPGNLFPVNPLGVRNVPGLFAKNERLITYLDTTGGEYAIVKVGATIVGSVQVVYNEKLSTNVRNGVLTNMKFKGPSLEKGDEIGLFKFGSTVVLLFHPGMVEFGEIQTGQFVMMGERIGTIAK